MMDKPKKFILQNSDGTLLEPRINERTVYIVRLYKVEHDKDADLFYFKIMEDR